MNITVTRLYSFGIGLAGLAVLIALSSSTLAQQILPLLLFAGLSLIIKRFGFHVFDDATGRLSRPRETRVGEVTHSLVGIMDLAALLVYGPVFGGWVAVLSEFTYLIIRRPRWTWRTLERWETAIFNAGLKALMALAGGAVFTALGGAYQPNRIAVGLLLPLAGLFLTWFGLDHIGWTMRIGLSAGIAAAVEFLQTVMLWSFLVELVPLPMALLVAVVYASLGWAGFVLLTGGFVVTGFIIQRLVEARRRLRARVTQLGTISEVSRQVASIVTLDELFSRVVDLIQESFEYDHAQIFTRDDGDLVFRASTGPSEKRWREVDYRVPAGEASIVNWVAEQAEPLLVNDVSKDSRYRVDRLGILTDTQAELAVPLIVEDRVVGVLDVQNKTSNTFDEDDLFVLKTLADQVAIAIEDARLYQQALERERLQQELAVALDIQTSLLPASLPEIPGWDVAAAWQPARNVAGDFYDFIPLRDGGWGILIADVSDKGVPAALFMAVARTLLRAMAIGKETPASALERANDLIMADARTDMFVTVFYAALDPTTSQMTYVNAGHVPPLFYKHEDRSLASLHAPGIALGVIPDIELEQRAITLRCGDLVVLYTDGITEAVDADYEDFGEERLARLIYQHHTAPAEELIEIITAAVRDFVGHRPPSDDQALLVLKRTGMDNKLQD